MDFIKSKNGLILPLQTGHYSTERDFSLNEVDAWRSQLPLSNVGTSAKALYEFLQDLHQAPINAHDRFIILSHLRPTLSYLCEILGKIYAEREALSEKQQLIADLVNALHFEMLTGYKLVIDAALNSLLTKRKLFISALLNAMVCCEKIIFDTYKQHRDPPHGVWYEFNTLYLLAKNKGVSQKSLSSHVEWQSRFSTLEELYKNCLLFAISNPYRLTKLELTHLTYALEVWAPLLILKPLSENSQGLFVIDLNSDQAPHYAAFNPTPSPSSFMLVLDKITLRLEKLLQDKTSTTTKKSSNYFLEAEQQLPNTFIESLLGSWQYIKERAQKRDKAKGAISVCLGISSCHWFISDELSANSQNHEASQDFHVIDLSIDQGAQKSQSYRYYDCQLVDQSEGGYCLQWIEEIPTQLQCGEIIAIQRVSPNHSKNWTIGTIRWLRHEKDHTILLGVQVLSHEVLAVYSSLEDAQSEHQTATLLLAEQPLHNKPKTLITPSLPFKAGQEIKVAFQDHAYPAVLQKNYSLSPCYQQFGIEFLYEQPDIPIMTTKPSRAAPPV
ncbi:MAG: hypothetical protein AB7I18_12135 [Candidatus Berkiella sp.]